MMIPPEKILKPEDVHPTHEVYDIGFIYSEPECIKCHRSVYDDAEMLRIPCEGKQGELFGRSTR